MPESPHLRVLLLEDSAADAERILSALDRAGLACDPLRCDSKASFLAALDGPAFDLILADYRLPAYSGMDALREVAARNYDAPFIFVSGAIDEETALACLREGASDYAFKDRLSSLPSIVLRSLRRFEDARQRARGEHALAESGEQLRALTLRVEGLREEERTRIAREVHDELGQALTAIKIEATQILVANLRGDAVNEHVRRVIAMADEAIAAVRRIASDLRPAVLDQLGLEAALEWQLRQFERRTGVHAWLEASAVPDMDDERRTVCFRIVQEALTNVARHADADSVHVVLGADGTDLRLEVIDNGVGIRPDAEEGRSLGLLGMRERAEALGGTLAISPVDTGGTRLALRIPVAGSAGQASHPGPS